MRLGFRTQVPGVQTSPFGGNTLAHNSLGKEDNLEKNKKIEEKDQAFIIKYIYFLPFYVFLHFYGYISPHYDLI